jgi:hypothetical protein
MDYAKLPRAFVGTLRIKPDEFTLEVIRLIVHADKVSFDFSGADGNNGPFVVAGAAGKTGNGTFWAQSVEPKYKTSIACPVGTIEFLVVDIKDDEAGEAEYDECRVEGVWREPTEQWAFSGTLRAFIPVK